MPTLFEIAADLQALDDALAGIEDAPEELQTQLETVFAAMQEATNEELAAKLDNYARLITVCQNKAELRKAEAAAYGAEYTRLKALAAADEAAARRLKDRLKVFMEVRGVKKLEGNLHTFSRVANGGKVPLIVDDVPISEIPSEFHKISVEIDNQAVRTVLESGEELGWARLGDRGSSVRIK